MTFEERVRALEHLRLTDRQTRFLVTVALHSGYCVRRQYLEFAGVRYGKNVRDFLDGLVFRGLALRFTYRLDRGHVYHLHARSIYRALRQDDNRNRRVASPALIARKLMLLDLALAEPTVEWLVTEDDKVEFFADRCGVDRVALPQRTFEAGSNEEAASTRYFVHKLPIYLAGQPAIPHFVYLASDASPLAFEQFLREHSRLWSRLPAWKIVCVKPMHVSDLRTFELGFRQFLAGSSSGRQDRLRKYFGVRRLVEDDRLGQLTVDDLYQYRKASRLYSTPAFDRLYADWLRDGDSVLGPLNDMPSTAGALEIRTLAHPYEQFGTMAGVA